MVRVVLASVLLLDIGWSCSQSPACEQESGCDDETDETDETEETEVPPDMLGETGS